MCVNVCVCVVCVCNNTAGPKLLSLNDSHRGFPVGLQVMSSPQTCLLQVDDTLEKCRLYDGVWLTVESIEVRGGGGGRGVALANTRGVTFMLCL